MSRYRPHILDLLIPLIIVAILLLQLARRGRGIEYDWNWQPLGEMFFFIDDDGSARAGLLLRGLAYTIIISVASFMPAFIIGLLAALARISSIQLLQRAAVIYVSTLRNLPPLIVVFIVHYFLLSSLDNVYLSAILSLSLYEGAYVTEIIRSGIIGVGKNQREAAAALGLSTRDSYLRVILPQALRQTLPPLSGEIISTIKNSAIVSVISVPELTMRAGHIQQIIDRPFESWLTAAGLYFILTLTVSTLLERFYQRVRRHF